MPRTAQELSQEALREAEALTDDRARAIVKAIVALAGELHAFAEMIREQGVQLDINLGGRE